MEIRKDIVTRLGIIYFLIVMLCVVIVAGVFKVQNVKTDRWKVIAKKIKENTVEIPAKRGNVCADDGTILATSIPEYEIRFDLVAPRVRKQFKEHVDEFAAELSDFYGTPKWRFKSRLNKAYLDSSRWFLVDAKKLDYSELQKFKKLKSLKRSVFGSGLIVVTENNRILPHGDLASRTIGVLNEGVGEGVHGAVGYTGIEGMQESYLAGENGKALKRNYSGRWINTPLVDPVDGLDVITTINVNLQDYAQNALMNQMVKSQAKWGTTVVMEVATGDIKAIANIGRKKDGGYAETYNFALGHAGCSEPGSTFKLMSLMVAMDHGFVDTCDVFDVGDGLWRVHGVPIKDSDYGHGGHGKITVKEIFELSSNVGTAKVISKFYEGREKDFIDRIYKFGLNKKLNLGIRGEGVPYIKYPTDKSWSGLSLAWMSHGYELKVTPLQTLTFYNAVANDGKMVKPRFVTEIQDNGLTVKTFKTEVINPSIVSRQTLGKAQAMLRGVCERGTGRSLRSPYYTLAGKTGTATIAYDNEGYTKGGKKNYQASFAGYFPAEDPKYSCIVVIVGPKGSYYGSSVAGPVFKEVADKVYATFLEQKDDAFENSDELPEIKTGYTQEINEVTKELNINVSKPVAEIAKPQNTSENIKWNKVKIEEGIVPDVSGMAASDALYLLESVGLRVKMKGIGKVKKQSPQAGQKFRHGQLIYIDLG